MTGSKRALAVFAAGALFAPLVSLGSPAYAVGEATPPPPRDVTELCQNVPEDFDPFTDIEGNTFEFNIECLAFAEITQGLSGGNQYGPGFSVTRGQMASFIARMIDAANDLDTGDNVRDLPAFDGEDSFTDVQEGYVHRSNIDRLDEAGIVQGGPGGRPTNIYGPELSVTRAQMASFIKRALEYMNGENFDTTQDFFTDDENAQPHEPNINAVAALGIAVGNGQDTFNPFQNVSRAQMSGFLTRTLDVLFEDGDIRAIGEEQQQPTEPTIVVETQNAQPGDDIVFTIQGENVESVVVTGECVVDEGGNTTGDGTQTFTEDSDTTQEDFQVSVGTRADFQGDSCVISLTVTDDNGESTQTVTVTFDQTQQASGVTDAPELIDAEFVRNTTDASGAETTTVRFDFDEAVISTVDAARFHLYEADSDVSFDGIRAVRGTGEDTDSVFVVFNIDADTFGEVTLATVDEGAVEDTDGLDNPIGDAPLGSGVTFAAGQTEGPDLLNIDNFRQAGTSTATSSATLVDFTFDEEVLDVQNPALGQFLLIHVDGTEFQGTPEEESSTTATDDFQGEGTATITVRFENTDTNGDGSPDAIDESRVARGIVLTNTVLDDEGNHNPLQAAEASNGGGTLLPDLESVTISDEGDNSTTSTTSARTVTFRFDENVTAADAGSFRIYDRDGDEEFGDSFDTTQDTDADDNIVVVRFDAETLDAIVGASVDDGAVREVGAGGSGTNQEDEVGTLDSESSTLAGFTTGPDLIDVTREVNTTTTTDAATGEQTTTEDSITFRFVFDDEATVINDNDTFFVVDADGSRTELIGCDELTRNAGTAEEEENIVECTVDDSDANFADVRDAVLGTVDDSAVIDDESDENPEGAETISDVQSGTA